MPRNRISSNKPRYEPYGRDNDRRRDDRPRENRPRENPDRRRGTGPGNELAHRRQREGRNALALVPRMEERQYVNQNGEVAAVDAVNRSAGGGRQNRIMAASDSGRGGLLVKSDRPEHFEKAARLIQDQTGASTIFSRMEPVFQDRIAHLRQDERYQQLVRESWNKSVPGWSRLGKPAVPAQGGQGSAGQTQQGQTAQGSQTAEGS
ncbi:hypothetical protein ACJZ2D_016240 [Fusarium nematophilum]